MAELDIHATCSVQIWYVTMFDMRLALATFVSILAGLRSQLHAVLVFFLIFVL